MAYDTLTRWPDAIVAVVPIESLVPCAVRFCRWWYPHSCAFAVGVDAPAYALDNAPAHAHTTDRMVVVANATTTAWM